ncbi:hypothetical protein B0G76_0786 [Paraburkholderia sp. BL23I1N1]|uniref:hypothetical protein n=1 Tax=Paraburkholderia sp. BL23I1N1 TaxID=1938802 RepID=UPI000E7478DC|nr:hypothetical protein [Paraburkholderia sp. BL23I1N1]RKE34762.1 hypothetical protein B0G76_0786 [Paraburkholderia sp. BL23I1N1]
MKGFFAFDWMLESSSPVRNFHFLFKPPGTFNVENLADAIEAGLQGINPPDVVAIICESEEATGVKKAFEQPLLVQASNRTSTKVCLCICSFGHDGTINRVDALTNPVADLERLFRGQSAAIRNAGLKELFSAKHVSVVAPPGFTFVKPSQKRSTHFLRAEEALTEVEGVQFLAFALLEKLCNRARKVGAKLDVIFVDTMGIAAVAYALRDMYCTLFDVPKPRVVTFHSHDGIDKIDAPLHGTSFTLISASSSMNLERDWKQKVKCDATEVVTLLTLLDAKDAQDALFALPAPAGLDDKPHHRHLKDLPIVGERFAPEDLLPKSVLLRKKEHRLPEVSDFCKAFGLNGALAVQARGPIPTAKVRPIYLDGRKLLDDLGFKHFADKLVSQQTPASVSAIVYQNDEASSEIAKHCAKRLQEVMNRATPLTLISDTEIESGDARLDSTAGILVVAAVVGRGTRLLSISRDLRDVHSGARTYFIGAQIAETAAQLSALPLNLKHSASGAEIRIERFMGVAVGQGIDESFEEELHAFRNILRQLGGPFFARLERLAGSANGLGNAVFMPRDDSLVEDMRLRPDFAYWDGFYEEANNTNAAVMATAGALLQNAREGKKFASEIDRLATDAFQQVILNPENFTRYNDGAIQAALLRCARPSELDYSREAGASQFMLDLLANIFEQHNRRQGEAACEFAFALYTRKLRLQQQHLDELKIRIRSKLEGTTHKLHLLRMLFEFDAMPTSETLPDEF